MFDFIAIDFETATYDQDPCQIGYVVVRDRQIVDQQCFLINPQASFNRYSIKIHGITPEDVKDAPCFPEIYEQILPLIRHYPIVAHNATFEREVLHNACYRYGLSIPKTTFYCTYSLYKENYPQLEKYSLDYLSELFSIELDSHHNALVDALACANLFEILNNNTDAAIYPLDAQEYVYKPHNKKGKEFSDTTNHPQVSLDNISYDTFEGFCTGDRFVITGTIPQCSRAQLFAQIEQLGGVMSNNISPKIKFLAVGLADTVLVADKETHKSNKLIKAEQLKEQGIPIKIVRLTDVYNFLCNKEKDT